MKIISMLKGVYEVKRKIVNEVTERLFIRRYSTSLIDSLVRSAITLNGIVLSSDGRLQHE